MDHGKSWRAVLTSVCAFSASLYLISIAPWYLLPFAWALSGTAAAGVRWCGGRTHWGQLAGCRRWGRCLRLVLPQTLLVSPPPPSP